MKACRTTEQTRRQPFALRGIACLMAVLLVTCFQVTPFQYAFAANSKSASASASEKSKSAKNDSKSLSTPDKKNTKDEKAEEDEEEDEEDEESTEEKARREEAEAKRAEADSLYALARTAQASFDKAKNEYDKAVETLDSAIGEREAAKVEYEQKSVEIEDMQESLSEYVVDMYKQGGATPYLDVMLRATSYQEFLTSWNMTVTVTEYGEKKVEEKKQLRQEIEEKLAEAEEQVKDAEREKALADSNRRQTNASRLALLVQAARSSVEAAELEDDDDALDEARDALADAEDELDEAMESGLAGDSLLSGTGYFTHPCPNATVSSGFGYRSFDNAMHKGLDLAAPEGTPYYAADSGKVTAATNGGGYNGGAGNWIVIDHGNGLVTKYMHSLVTFVSVGDKVERGQNIGLVGNTGQSFGAHLHFQVETNGTAVNPVVYL